MSTCRLSIGIRAFRSLPFAAFVTLCAAFAAIADNGPPHPAGVLFSERQQGEAAVSIIFLSQDPGSENASALKQPTDHSRLIVTGAYSSGDRFAPEGFVLRDGEPVHPWPQGWDGLLLVSPDGSAWVHDVSKVAYRGARYDLRDRDQRSAFLDIAARDGLSAVQSHLLINDGALDLRPVEDAPRFRRRMFFQMADGRIGVYDTSPRAVTLYEAAGELLDAMNPEMALNLDMGAYDFCEQTSRDGVRQCGLLGRDRMEQLTNLIAISHSGGVSQ